MSASPAFRLTETGSDKVCEFIEDLEIRRSELIHAGYADEDDEAIIPDTDMILDDIAECVREDGTYISHWEATETDNPRTLELHEGEDFVIKDHHKT